MAIEYPAILSLREEGHRFHYTDRDTMLYALAIGLGSDPLDERELPFIYERELKAVPSMATVIAWGAGVSTDRLGANYKLILHGEEEIVFHRPLPPTAEIIADSGVIEVYDKGAGKGAVIVRETRIRTAADDAPLATIYRTVFARGDGGCGGSPNPAPKPHTVPGRAPDRSLLITTRRDQAALYRLLGDRNPLHIDPERATAAGFTKPILHGLCTYGLTCRAVLAVYCHYDPDQIASHGARLSGPMYPGETLQIDMWRDDDIISFEAFVPERSVTVVKNGRTVLRNLG
jgi:acyl dehydratase